MKVHNIAGDGSWNAIPLFQGVEVTLTIQNSTSVDTLLRMRSTPGDVFTIKSGTVLEVHGRFYHQNQIELSSASGTIQVIVGTVPN